MQKFDDEGTLLDMWGQTGATDGRFEDPSGLTIDAADNVYVADNLNYRVQKFDSAGTFIDKWGTQGTGSGEFVGPTDIQPFRARISTWPTRTAPSAGSRSSPPAASFSPDGEA